MRSVTVHPSPSRQLCSVLLNKICTQLFLMNHGVSHGLPSMNLETLLKSSFSFQCLIYLICFLITSKSRKMGLEKQLQLSDCPPCWMLETAEENWG